jgi:hypothetical protein
MQQMSAEVHCYHCGRVTGSWEWPSSATGEWGIFQAATSATRTAGRLAQVRCLHCGGPVYLDEIERLPPPLVLNFEKSRRGRPSKSVQRLVS